MSRLNQIGVKLAAAFALVAVVSVSAVGLSARIAVQSEFQGYLYDVWVRRGTPGPAGAGREGWRPEVPPPSDEARPRPPRPRWQAMALLMSGLPERRFLARVDRLLWHLGVVVAGGGAVAGALVARRWSQRLNRLADRALQRARREPGPLPVEGDELDQLDAAFAAMEQALAKEDQRRRRLLADIAHDLKTPLAVLQANLEAMLDGVVPPAPERLAALHTQVGLLSRLVTDLRELAMAEAGELTLRRSDQDVERLVRQVVDLWRPQAQERGVHVELQVEGRPRASLDPDRFAQVLLNLLSNALRHAPAERGWIGIFVHPREEPAGLPRSGGPPPLSGVEVRVEDNGPGIAPEELPYIFDHFYRGDPARSRSTGGFGVGLGIVRSLVEAHGGRVRAGNRSEGGARFVIWLPEAPAEARP